MGLEAVPEATGSTGRERWTRARVLTRHKANFSYKAEGNEAERPGRFLGHLNWRWGG